LALKIQNPKNLLLVITAFGNILAFFPGIEVKMALRGNLLKTLLFMLGLFRATKSYTVIVRGGYRELNEFTVKYIKNGDDAVGFINDYSRKPRRTSR